MQASNIRGLGSSAAADSPYRHSLITPTTNHLISHESRGCGPAAL